MARNLLIVFLLATIIANGQTDTSKSSVPETWPRLQFGLRAAAGIQKNFYTEFGFTLQRYIYEARHGYIVYTWYTAYEWTPPSHGKEQVNGIKIGAEMVNNGGAGGIEVKYLFNSKAEDVVITPKIGWGMGFANLFYGFNISTRKYPFPNVRKSQFSLVVNSNIFHHDRKRKNK